MKHLSDKDRVDIVRAFSIDLIPIIELATRYNRTRQGIYKVLGAAGIDTSKAAATLDVSCTACGTEVKRTRSLVRKTKHIFCSTECYRAYLTAGASGYAENSHSRARARKLIANYFTLLSGNIVHHKDGNQLNNELNNLTVFKNQGDHIRHHRGFDSQPIFEGSSI